MFTRVALEGIQKLSIVSNEFLHTFEMLRLKEYSFTETE